mmetsp:Transcript_5/g.11  ORF Transcript_5/g.11 Transcript_5/m.11 type:complete len:107 (+) Transcript_5:3-323(+)
MIVLLKGQRRFLLSPTDQCPLLQLYEVGHPSSRQTSLDFMNLPLDSPLLMNEVILRPGDAIYLPSFWFHSIISLTEDMAQCAAWSDGTHNRWHLVEGCDRPASQMW